MTRVQRRSKSQWIRRMKRLGYSWSRGRLWRQFIWKLTINLEDE